jgi:hypothetical protein
MPFDISQREMILIAVIGGLVLVCIYMYKTKENIEQVAPVAQKIQTIVEPKKVVCDENSCYVSESSSGVELETETEEEEEDNSIDIVEGEGEGEEEKEEVDPPITLSD